MRPRGCGWRASTAVTMAAREPFMSAAPRPYRRPWRMAGVKGGEVQDEAGPGGLAAGVLGGHRGALHQGAGERQGAVAHPPRASA